MRQTEYAKCDNIAENEAKIMAAASASISIPKNDLPVLKAISGLGDKEFNSLLSAIRATKPTLSKGKFVRIISENAQTIQKSEIAAILKVVFILYSMKERVGMDLEGSQYGTVAVVMKRSL